MNSTRHTAQPPPRNLWLHDLIMLILVLLVNLAQTVLGICAILQFFWMLFTNERNPGIAWFGQGLARWLAITARFLTVANFHGGGDGEALMRGMRQHPCTEGL